MKLSRLDSASSHAALDVTVAVTCGLSLLIVWWLARRSPAAPAAAPPADAAPGRAWLAWVAFVAVCALLLGNQLLVNAYILATHDGDASFVTRYLGHGWFVGVPTAPPVRWLATHLPASWLRGPLSYSVLRVQAVLELPFALLAYVSVVAMFDPALSRRLVHSALLPLAAVSFTFTFCLIELRLYSPWTPSDLVGRWLAAAAVIVWWQLYRGRRTVAPTLTAPNLGLGGLLVFFLGAAAAGAVVLCMYDVALLYNLGHLPARLPIVAAGLVLGSLATLAQAKKESGAAAAWLPGPGIHSLTTFLAAFATLFFAPSLCIRYCGERPSAIIGVAVLMLGSLVLGVRLLSRSLAARRIPRWQGLTGIAVALGTALVLLSSDATSRIFGTHQPLFELFLLEAAALLFPGMAVAVWGLDCVLRRGSVV